MSDVVANVKAFLRSVYAATAEKEDRTASARKMAKRASRGAAQKREPGAATCSIIRRLTLTVV